jgi:hypothetical protein
MMGPRRVQTVQICFLPQVYLVGTTVGMNRYREAQLNAQEGRITPFKEAS